MLFRSDAQHRDMDIVHLVEQMRVQFVVTEIIVVVTIHIHRILQHHIHHQVVVEVAEVVVVQEVQNLVGQEQVRQFITHLLK